MTTKPSIDSLVNEICDNDLFKRAGRHTQILRFLAANSETGTAARQRRRDGLVKFNNGDGESLATLVGRVQDRLDALYSSPAGKQAPFRITIVRATREAPRPPDLYAIRIAENVRALSVTRAFWDPYFDPAVPVWVVYGEPLFMTTAEHPGVFTRDMKINRPEQVPSDQRAVYRYIRLGEVHCLLEIVRYFTDAKVALNFLASRKEHGLEELGNGAGTGPTNIIVLGNTFSNGILEAYQDHRALCYFLDGSRILCRSPEGEQSAFEDGKDPEFDDCITTHVLVTRRLGFDVTTSITTIASDNGPAIHRVGLILCKEEECRRLFRPERIPTRDTSTFPTEFQLVIKVWVHDHGDWPIRCEPVGWWQR